MSMLKRSYELNLINRGENFDDNVTISKRNHVVKIFANITIVMVKLSKITGKT